MDDLHDEAALGAQLRAEVARSGRTGRPFSLLYVAIDVPPGSATLRRAAAAVRDQVRSIDVPARVDGDAIAVLLPETDRARGRAVAERLRAHVAGVMAGEGAAGEGPAAVRVGLATHPEDGRTAQDLVQAAVAAAARASRRTG